MTVPEMPDRDLEHAVMLDIYRVMTYEVHARRNGTYYEMSRYLAEFLSQEGLIHDYGDGVYVASDKGQYYYEHPFALTPDEPAYQNWQSYVTVALQYSDEIAREAWEGYQENKQWWAHGAVADPALYYWESKYGEREMNELSHHDD